MISELIIERFKCYRSASFRLGSLTVLTGTNGAGKSTVIQALLLARLARQSPNGDVPLKDESYGLDLGEMLDVLYHGSATEEGFRVTVREEGQSPDAVDFHGQDRSRTLKAKTTQPGGATVLSAPPRLFTYLSADRLGPQTVYPAQTFGDGGTNVGCRGEGVGQVLVDTERKFVSESLARLLPSGESAPKDVPRQTELWLSHIVRPVEIEAKAIPEASFVALRFREPGSVNEWMRPANTGFGLTSALPIIVAALSAEPGGVLIIENPETHLHPAAQSRMGDFLTKVAGTGVQVLVETHSDHVLNGIRRAAVIDRVIACNDVLVHFFDDVSDGEAQLEVSVSTLTLMDNGDMSNWPRRFFDQIETDLSALAEARRRR